MDQPLVSVICLCYNHQEFIKEAIESVLQQTYKHIQLIVVDDCSTDKSVTIIRKIIADNPQIEFYPLENNLGNCAAFNRGLAHVKGDFVIDFSTDDVMLPDRIERQVNQFHQLDPTYGVVFSDALYISKDGTSLYRHHDYLIRKRSLKKIPQGNIYKDLLTSFFICPPTMMTRKSVFDSLQGYDEQLTFEDFDFWVRSSRNFKYAFLNVVTTKVRISEHSMSASLYSKGDKLLYSTYFVCEKAFHLNKTEEEQECLAKRLRYEIRQSVFSENYREAELFFQLLVRMKKADRISRVLMGINKLKLPLGSFRRLYNKLRYNK
jgi:glycosyltransferase involved in cell wall biosynthesis